MATSIADLFVSVSADVSGAINGLNQVGTQLNSTTAAFDAARPAALAFTAAAGAVAAGLISSIGVAADFEHQMSGIKAVMSPDEVNTFGSALTNLALKLGRDTVFSSQEAAAGIEELIKAGIPAADVVNGAADAALALAAATGIPVAQAATVAGTAMNTFGIKASDLSGVVDLLAGTANASAADISQLQFGLQAVGPVASQMGLSLADTTAALGIFANNGLRGQDAGTSLKTMLLNLVPSTKKASNEFKQLGLITEDGSNIFFDAEGHIRDLADISQILQDALGGLSDEQRINTLQTLFGTDAVRAAAILFKTGGDAVNQFHEEAGKVSALDAQKIRLDNLDGALKNLGGSLELLQIQIGTLFLPRLRDMAAFLTDVTNALTTLDPQTQAFLTFAIAGTAAVIGLLGAFVLISPFLASLPAAFAALGAAIDIAFGPIGIAVLAIAALAAGLVFLYQNSELVRGSIDGVWDFLSNKLFPAVIAAATAIGTLLTPALSFMGTQMANLSPLFSGLTAVFGAIFNVLGSIARLGATELQGLFEKVLVPGLTSFGQTLGGLATPIGTFLGQIGPLNGAFQALGGFIQAIPTFLTDAATALNDFARTIQVFTFQLPDWAKPSGVGGPLAPAVAGPGGAPTNFTPATGPGATAPLINIGVLNVSDESQRAALLADISVAVLGSATRVESPPDTSSNPQLVP